jgi:tellurite resistance protein TerC
MQPTPLSHWIGFHLFILALLAAELVYSRNRGKSQVQSTAVAATIIWVTAALAFAAFIHHTLGSESSIQYLAGYAIEESLSIDNLFVFLLLFRLFQIETAHQPKVLFWGVLGAIIMRGAFISAGIGLLDRFHWISYLFAAILLFAAGRLLLPEESPAEKKPPSWIVWVSRLHPVSLRQDKFFVREQASPNEKPRPMMTMLFLALLAIEITDVVFALDSIPAVLSITRHPFIAYTSNIMAVMGLRSLYFLLARLLEKLRFLHYGLAGVLAFAACKMLAAAWIEIGPLISLGVIVGILGVTITVSLIFPMEHLPSS